MTHKTYYEVVAFHHESGVPNIDLEVPFDRAAEVESYHSEPIDGALLAELRHGARVLTETPGGLSMSTRSGWTLHLAGGVGELGRFVILAGAAASGE
jgi:hypothetical protein